MFNNNKIFFNCMGGGYRPDIDGLRAIACISVVLFHSFPKYMQGGFIGVDIFFVISGFLISSIIYRNLFNPEFSGQLNLYDFYLRRIKRIFPALITVLVFSIVVGWYVLLPEEFRLLGKHTFGGATYINNIMLYKESSKYFNPDSNTKVLLHLWSLGVEEQFYLIFPIIIFLLYKFNLNFILSLSTLTVVSFILNKNGIKHDNQSYSFYLPYCRFWELSVGALLAYILNYNSNFIKFVHYLLEKHRIESYIAKLIFRNPTKYNQKDIINNILSFIGICIIILGIFKVKKDLNFPGYIALIPVIGSLLIILAGQKTIVNKYILSNRIMVFLGLISYPLYLWHWPILSFVYICEGQNPNRWIRLTAVLIALIMAILTYFFIESPFRYGKYSRIKASTLFITLVCVGIIGNRIYHSDGFGFRFPNKPVYTAPEVSTKKYKDTQMFSIDDKYVDNCKVVFQHWNDLDTATTCAWQKEQNKNNIAIVGSSHASHLFYGLSTVYKKTENGVAVFPMGSQSPFLGLNANGMDWYKRIEDAYSYIEQHKNLKLIILADYAFNMNNYADMKNPNEKDPVKILENCIRRSIEMLKDRKVIIALDNPQVPFHPSLCYRPITITQKKCSFSRSETSYVRDIHNKIIKDIAKDYNNVEIFDPDPLFCKNEICKLKNNSEILYLDSGHLSYQGSLYVGKHLMKIVNKLLR